MKKIVLFILFVQIPLQVGQRELAAEYLYYKGIKIHQSIVFAEDFEETTLEGVAAHWNTVKNLEGMSLSSDVSSISSGKQSLMMTSVIGKNTGGYLYKRLDGYDTLYARFYVKFAQSCHPVHHFVHMGGYNPPTDWPQGGAGERPRGDERFTTGIEPIGSDWRWDFYTYWMHMRGNPVPNTYWGNTFHPAPEVPVERGCWICVEMMMKCNNPVDSYNGEQAFWIDGKEAIHLGEGFPNGYWVWDKFYSHPDSLPFEGLQWRIVDDLKINFFWLLFYMTKGETGQIDTVWFDDIIVATEYIGPIKGIEENTPQPKTCILFQNHPNPFDMGTYIQYSLPEKKRVKLVIYDILGQRAKTLLDKEENPGEHIIYWDGKDNRSKRLPSGIYFYRIEAGNFRETKKLLILK